MGLTHFGGLIGILPSSESVSSVEGGLIEGGLISEKEDGRSKIRK